MSGQSRYKTRAIACVGVHADTREHRLHPPKLAQSSGLRLKRIRYRDWSRLQCVRLPRVVESPVRGGLGAGAIAVPSAGDIWRSTSRSGSSVGKGPSCRRKLPRELRRVSGLNLPVRMSPAPESFGWGYCADVATFSVSILNLETAACAAVLDVAVVAPSGTDGSALFSAVA